MDFQRIDELVSAGYDSTYRSIAKIKARVTRKVNSDSIAFARIRYQSKFPPYYFRDINISGLKQNQKQYFLRSFWKRNDRTFNYKILEREYFKLVSDNNVVSIYPIAKYDTSTGYYNLDLKVSTDDYLDVSLVEIFLLVV